ncbi:equilibrative nucleoside transporter 3-like [Anoplophora glabripennis]|uniref:equilibrative nucleoside transporter 3-like n=1 Tax=Anoplophora glabripennis TaxID=217634 RepID=UPI000C785FF1|nr:equilibrative nucleoside transporter 3-like [Anoplophora glabripennis]
MVKIKKVSVVSIESVKIASAKLQKHWESVHLKDNFYYVHILFLLVGLMHFLPYPFFVTANAYWMDKFRNISSDDLYDASKRTGLQSHFASGISICNSIPNCIVAILSTLFGHKLKPRLRVNFTLSVMFICFIVTTLFVYINTDTWQTLFFCVTFAVLATLIAANAALQMAVFVLLAKFPPYFMKVYLFGQGCAPVFTALLQIMTLAIGTTTKTSALIYFGIGSSVMGFTLVLFYFSKYNDYYMYFVNHFEEDITRDMLSFAQIKFILKTIWPVMFMYVCFDLAKIPQTPVTSLVVSENYGSGNDWNDIYFVPVISFLFSDICTLTGRVVCSIIKPMPISLAMIFSASRVVIYIPLVLLCNAQPRNHLPVVFGHDWEYVIIVGTLSITNGYLYNLAFLSIHQIMDPENIEDTYLVFASTICTIAASMSPLSALSVDLL